MLPSNSLLSLFFLLLWLNLSKSWDVSPSLDCLISFFFLFSKFKQSGFLIKLKYIRNWRGYCTFLLWIINLESINFKPMKFIDDIHSIKFVINWIYYPFLLWKYISLKFTLRNYFFISNSSKNRLKNVDLIKDFIYLQIKYLQSKITKSYFINYLPDDPNSLH